MGLGRLISNSLTHTDLHKPNNKLVSVWLEHFRAQTSHRQTQTHKIHHGLDLGEATTFPLIVYSMPGHGTNTQMSFCPGTPKWESRNSHNWDFCDFGGPITLCVDLQLKWGLNQSCSPCWDLSNDMLHAICMQQNWGNFWLLVVENQIANLTPDTSFGNNLCFKCPNGSCQPTLDIYILGAFQWYKELFNPTGLASWNYSLNVWVSIGTPTPKVGVHLGVWGFIPSHFPTFSRTWDATHWLPSWPTPLQALALLASPKLRLWQNCRSNAHR